MQLIQIGLGDFGRSWVQVVRGAPGVELTAIVDPSPSARSWAVEELGMPKELCFEGLDEALAVTDADAVLVVTPEHTHFTVALSALDAGKHVLVEKPLTTTLEDAKLLIDKAARGNRILMASQNYRYRPAARTVQRLVAEGAIGELVSAKVVCRRDTHALWPTIPSRYEMRHPYLLGMAIHHFDMVRAATGKNVERVYAQSWRVPDSPFSHHPAMAALLSLEGGASVTYEGDWATRDEQTSWDGEWEIVGEEGRLLWGSGRTDVGQQEVRLQRWGGSPHSVPLQDLAVTDRSAVLEVLRGAVSGGPQPETVASDNINSLAILVACLKSVEEGEHVDVTELLSSSS